MFNSSLHFQYQGRVYASSNRGNHIAARTSSLPKVLHKISHLTPQVRDGTIICSWKNTKETWKYCSADAISVRFINGDSSIWATAFLTLSSNDFASKQANDKGIVIKVVKQ